MTPPDPAFDALLEDCAWLRRLARRLVPDAHRAEDFVQDTLVAAWVRLEADERRGRPGRGWLASVLRNFVRQDRRSELARRGRERVAGGARRDGGFEPSSLDVAERLELQRALVEAVQGLEEPYRSTLVERFFDGRPPREIARRAGVPVKTVNTRLERGVAKLRARLDARFGGRSSGDRRAWARALAPLAPSLGTRIGTAAGALAGSTAVPLALVLAAVAAGAWIFGGGDPAPGPAAPRAVEPRLEDPDAPPESPGSLAPQAAGEPLAETLVRAAPLAQRARVPADEEGAPHGAQPSDSLYVCRVLDGASGARIAGALVRRLGEDGVATQSDEEGLFALEAAASGLLELRHPDYGPVLAEMRPDGFQVGRVAEVPMHRSARIEGRVLSARPGDEVFVAVTARDFEERAGIETGPALHWSTPVGPGGGVLLAGLPARVPLRVEIRAGGRARWRVPEALILDPGERREVSWQTGPAVRVLGNLAGARRATEVWALANGEAGSDPERLLEARDRRRAAAVARTDGAGSFELDGLGPGSWWIGAGPLAVRVDLAAEQAERRLELTLQPELDITGRVTSGTEGLAGPVTVRAQRGDTEGTAEARADPEGFFRLASLPPGRYVLWAHGAHPFDRSEYVHAEAGDVDVPLVIDLGTSLSGTVVDGDTGEPTNAHVHLISARGSLGFGTGGEGAGVFRFAGLHAGVYSLTAGTDDGRFALLGDVPLEEGESQRGLLLELRPGATLEIELAGGLASARCAIYAEGVPIADFTLRRGEKATERVPAGPLLLQLYTGGSGAGREVSLERSLAPSAGARETVVFELP